MKAVRVHLRQRSYDIIVGKNILSRIGKTVRSLCIGDHAIVITNRMIHKLYGGVLEKSLRAQGISVHFIEVFDSEKSKSARTAFDVIQKIVSLNIAKRPFIIAFGGGVVGDLAGFVAAIYKRGVAYIQVPTTFLAQIDSAIGGKVAVDLPVAKNLVGAFYQPKLVFSDVSLLKTLNARQIRNGLAEAIKYGVIKDQKLFYKICRYFKEILSKDLQYIYFIVLQCSRIKADIVGADEREEKGLRTILNFGHTVGHAVEAAGSYDRWQHGEAISLGMRVAALIATQRKIFPKKNAQELEHLLDRVGLPKQINFVKFSKLMKAIGHDKKNISGKNRFVLPVKIGCVKVVTGIPEDEIRCAVRKYMTGSLSFKNQG